MSKSSRRAAARDAAMKRLTGEASVGELVSGLGTQGFSRDEAVAALISLQQDKKLAVEERAPYSSLGAYALSPLSLWFWASIAAIAASLALISVSSGVVVYLRYVFGSALVLFIPGYSLIEALYPKRELDELTRVALSIGLSLALVPLTGLVLNYTPFGIRLLPVAVSIAGMSVILLLVALVRKHAYYKLAKGA